MTAEQKIKYLPAGGIAGFVMSDEQVEQLEAEELQEPKKGSENPREACSHP